jgi:hypothetical protein
MRWSRCCWSTLVPSAGPLPHEAAQAWPPPTPPLGGHASAPAPIHTFHLFSVGMVRHAIEQMDDPVWIQIQGSRLPPELPGAGQIGPHKLGLHQLTREQKHQLALLQGSKAQPCRLPLQGAATPPRPSTGPGHAG